MKRIFNQEGFSLVEMLVVIVILSFVTILATDFLITVLGIAGKTNNKISVEQEYTFLNLKLSQGIQEATGVSFCGGGSGNNCINLTKGTRTYNFSFATSKLFYREYNTGIAPLPAYEELNHNPIENFSLNIGSNPTTVELSFDITRNKENQLFKATTSLNRKFILYKVR